MDRIDVSKIQTDILKQMNKVAELTKRINEYCYEVELLERQVNQLLIEVNLEAAV
jgi:hypothetical protein